MKKLLSILLILAMLVLPMLSACGTDGEPEESEKEQIDVMKEIRKAMNAATSYECNGQVELKAYVNEEEIVVHGTSYEVNFNDSDDPYYYSETTSNTTYQGTYFENIIVEAYNDGNFFYAYGEGNRKRKFYSELSAEEFEEYMSRVKEDSDLLESYGNIFDEVNADGSHTVTLSNYSKDAIRRINAYMDFPMEDGGAEITHIEVTINAAKAYLVNDITVKYIFSDERYSASQTNIFYNYNCANKNLVDVKTSAYTKVDDARIMPMINHLIDDRMNCDYGTFDYTNEVEITLSGELIGGTPTNYDVIYGNEDGFFFDISGDEVGVACSYVYKGGVYEEDGKVVEDSDFNDVSAKQFITSIVDPFDYNQISTKSMTASVADDGTVNYRINLNENDSTIPDVMKALYAELGLTLYNLPVDSYLVVSVKDYQLVSFGYELSAVVNVTVASTNKRGALRVSMTVTTVFDSNDDTTTHI